MHLETNNSTQTKESLSVLIHQNGLSFFTYHSNEVVDQWHHDFSIAANPISILTKIEELFSNTSALQKEFHKVHLLYHHEMFTLVPTSYFNAESASDYLKYNVHLLSNDVISYDEGLMNGEITLVYLAYENINNFFFNKFGQFEYYHYSSYLIQQIVQNETSKTTQVVVELFQTDFYLSIVKDQQLTSHNLFKYDTVEDVLYYVMFSIQQNELDPDSLICTVKSNSDISKVHDLLYNYIRNVVIEDNYNNYLTQLLCV
jgi:hypothetical protein